MKYLKNKRVWALALGFFVALALIAGAVTDGIPWGKDSQNRHFTKKIWVDGTGYFGDTITAAGGLDVTGAITGASLAADPWTGDNSETIGNATDNIIKLTYGGSTAALGELRLVSGTASSADNDALKALSVYTYNDNATPALFEFGRLTFTATDITTTTYDSTAAILLQTAGTSDPVAVATFGANAVTLAAGTSIVAPGGITAGSAALVEAELEQIDAVTAGTGAANKALVLGPTAALNALRVLGGVTVDGAVTAGSVTTTGTATVAGLTAGSAALSEAELETIDGVTAGTVAASKAIVTGATNAISALRVLGATIVDGTVTAGNLSTTGTVTTAGITIGSAVIVESELEQIDTVTAGTRAASKAAVVAADGTIDAWDVTGALTGMKSVITVTTDTTLTAAQCKGTFIYIAAAASDTTVTLTVPTLVAGYDFIVCDNDLTAGADVEVQMGADDKVNGGTAAKIYKHGNASTAVGTAHFISADDTDLILVGTPTDSGNWANDNS